MTVWRVSNSNHFLTSGWANLFLDKYDARVSDECYVDVTRKDSLLYAVMYSAKIKSKLHVYDESIKTDAGTSWAIAKTLTLPCDGYATIDVRCSRTLCLCRRKLCMIVTSWKSCMQICTSVAIEIEMLSYCAV